MMDPVVLIVLGVCLVAALVYVFVFMPETNEEQDALNEIWGRVAKKLGLTLTPYSGESFGISMEGEIEGVKIECVPLEIPFPKKETRMPKTHRTRRERRRERRRSPGGMHNTRQEVTIFTTNLDSLWPEEVTIGRMLEKDQSAMVEADSSLGDPEFDQNVLVLGVRQEELKQALSQDRVRDFIWKGITTYDWLLIEKRSIRIMVVGVRKDGEKIAEIIEYLVQLARMLNQAGYDGNPFTDKHSQQEAEPVAADAPW